MKTKVFREVKTLEELEIEEREVISQVEAARMLGISREGVASLMKTGTLPIIVRPGRTRLYTLREPVVELAERRKSR